MLLFSDGSQACGGRGGRSGMKRVMSGVTHDVIMSGVTGMPGTAADGAPQNTCWQQEWPLT